MTDLAILPITPGGPALADDIGGAVDEGVGVWGSRRAWPVGIHGRCGRWTSPEFAVGTDHLAGTAGREGTPTDASDLEAAPDALVSSLCLPKKVPKLC
jgi:hypothetical protein